MSLGKNSLFSCPLPLILIHHFFLYNRSLFVMFRKSFLTLNLLIHSLLLCSKDYCFIFHIQILHLKLIFECGEKKRSSFLPPCRYPIDIIQLFKMFFPCLSAMPLFDISPVSPFVELSLDTLH